MRLPVLTLPLMLLFGSCSLFSSDPIMDFEQPNSLMAEEIENRVQQIPFQHRDELLQNLLWLTQTGETTIPALLRGLQHESPKVRSSCAWALGRIGERRTIPLLQNLTNDANQTVRLEVARSLVMLGDLKPAPKLIEGLDSDKKEVRYLCHEALKAATGRDFGFDHLSDNETQRRVAVLGWRQWWSDYSGDPMFASSYEQRFNLSHPAQPMGEQQPMDSRDMLYLDPMNQQDPQGQGSQGQNPGQGTQGQNPQGQDGTQGSNVIVMPEEPSVDQTQDPKTDPTQNQPIDLPVVDPQKQGGQGTDPVTDPNADPMGTDPSGTDPDGTGGSTPTDPNGGQGKSSLFGG